MLLNLCPSLTKRGKPSKNPQKRPVPSSPVSGPDLRTSLLQFGLYTTSWGRGVVFGQAKGPPAPRGLGGATSLLLLRKHLCLAPGWLSPSLQQEEGKSSFADKTEHGARPAATQLVCPCVCPPGSLFLCCRSRRGAVHVAGCSSPASAPSAGRGPAGELPQCPHAMQQAVLAQDGQVRAQVWPCTQLPSPIQKRLGPKQQQAKRHSPRVTGLTDWELSQAPALPSTISGCSAFPLWLCTAQKRRWFGGWHPVLLEG